MEATPASTTLVSGPRNDSYGSSPSVTFQLGADDPESTYDCRLYLVGRVAPAFAPCAGGAFTASDLQQGAFVFDGRATNRLGNPDPTPVVRRFTVDSDPPDTSSTRGPAGVARSSSATRSFTFGLAADEPVSGYQCRLDAGAWTTCTATPTCTVGRGDHVLRARAVDRARNVDPALAVRRWSLGRPLA